MTHEWNPGDWALVQLKIVKKEGFARLVSAYNSSNWVQIECLHPLPTPDPLTELERRVVEAAGPCLDWLRENTPLALSSTTCFQELAIAHAALLAARAPKDPVAEIKAAFALIDGERDPDCRDTEEWGRLRRAVAALEAGK